MGHVAFSLHVNMNIAIDYSDIQALTDETPMFCTTYPHEMCTDQPGCVWYRLLTKFEDVEKLETAHLGLTRAYAFYLPVSMDAMTCNDELLYSEDQNDTRYNLVAAPGEQDLWWLSVQASLNARKLPSMNLLDVDIGLELLQQESQKYCTTCRTMHEFVDVGPEYVIDGNNYYQVILDNSHSQSATFHFLWDQELRPFYRGLEQHIYMEEIVYSY